MKKRLLALAILLALAPLAQAQMSGERVDLPRTEITAYTGYQWVSSVASTNGNIDINNGQNWGIQIGLDAKPGIQFEILYNHLSSGVRVPYYGNISTQQFDVNIETIQLGAAREFNQTKMRPFAAAMLGAMIFVPQTTSYSDEWRFSFSFALGAKYYMSDRIALKVQGRLMGPLLFSGVGIFCGTGGCSGGATGTSSILMTELSGGLVVTF
jgi:opacity protein-like surface antigen